MINALKNRLTENKTCYGVISPTTDPTVCEYLGWMGLDFYIIDGEHGPITLTETTHMVRAMECAGITPLARVRSLDEKLILQFLDAGVMGIMMPGTESAADCERLVKAVKYHPMGERGLGPVRAARYMSGGVTQQQYIEAANVATLVLPMVESIQAVEELEAMCRVPGIDGFIIGPRDLALSMGFTDGPQHAAVKELIDKAIAIMVQHGKIAGTVAANAEQAKELSAKGVRLLLNSVQGLLATGVSAFTKERIK
jgi:4-hydroxy-2-oxoheptanedioate aldolase